MTGFYALAIVTANRFVESVGGSSTIAFVLAIVIVLLFDPARRRMRIALINPPPAGEREKHWAEYPVLGLAYVAASLRAKGHDIVLLDGKLDELSVDAIA